MNLSDLKRNAYMLRGSDAKRGYMRWWHSFQGICPTTQETRTFFVEYSILNPALGTSQPILGQHPYYKRHGLKPSYLCIKAGVFPEPGDSGLQLRAYYPLTSLQVAQDPFYMQFEDCVYSENRISGSIDISDEVARHRSLMTDAGSFIWDLEVHKAVACHTGYIANAFFTAVHALESFWHGEGIRTFFRGTVILNGVTYEVTPETSYGYADKHWGRSYNQPWLQFASGHLISEKTGRELSEISLFPHATQDSDAADLYRGRFRVSFWQTSYTVPLQVESERDQQTFYLAFQSPEPHFRCTDLRKLQQRADDAVTL